MEHTELYDILGVDKDATDDDIKTSYNKLIEQLKPDINPEAEEKYKDVSFAYEVLSDPEKRKFYDLYGYQDSSDFFNNSTEALQQLFSSQSSDYGNFRYIRGKLSAMVEVTLEEMYTGVTKTLKFNRTEICEQCEGHGAPKDAFETCPKCEGFYEAFCDCLGRGTVIKEENRCSSCAGDGLLQVSQTREIIIERGTLNSAYITFPSEGNQTHNGQRGDLIVKVLQISHPVFVRYHNDLALRKLHLSITQALCGFEHVFKHLDGRNICISNKPGEVIRPGDKKIVPGEGMPLRNNPFGKGDLYVDFTVDFPDNNFATLEQLKTLEPMLPPREPFIMPDEAEEVKLEIPLGYGEAYAQSPDEEEFFMAGPMFDGVQCQTA